MIFRTLVRDLKLYKSSLRTVEWIFAFSSNSTVFHIIKMFLARRIKWKEPLSHESRAVERYFLTQKILSSSWLWVEITIYNHSEFSLINICLYMDVINESEWALLCASFPFVASLKLNFQQSFHCEVETKITKSRFWLWTFKVYAFENVSMLTTRIKSTIWVTSYTWVVLSRTSSVSKLFGSTSICLVFVYVHSFIR